MGRPADIQRRAVLRLAALGFPALALSTSTLAARSPGNDDRISARARQLVERGLVIDMLAPPRLDLDPSSMTRALTEKEREDFLRSGVTAIHNSIGIGGPGARTDALIFLAGSQGFAGRNADLFSLIGSVADLDRAKATRKIGMIMGLQNAEQFDTIEDVALFYSLGLRCAQLTYNTMNRIGAGCTERVDGGVSDYGAAVIAEMNRVGMLIDVSHSGDRTTLDAIEISKAPIAITHSNCRALSNHPRAKTDETIVALAKKGGVFGISGVRQFVSAKEPTTLGDIADHIDHVTKLTGVEHVGIGSDADLYGYDALSPEHLKQLKASYKGAYGFRDKIDIEGFDNPLKFYALTEELIRRGWKDRDIALVLGGNFRRLLGEVWR